jgi:glycosyltransferase involved in cell wall biosynthesis
MKILHVTEALGGGVTLAINSYVDATAEFDHFLFAAKRGCDQTGKEGENRFSSQRIVSRSLNAVFEFYKYLKEIDPDVIHVHSTYAGFFVRLLPFVKSGKVVYTPHGFSFLRKSNPFLLKVYYFIELVLSYRTGFFAACGKEEYDYAKKISSKSNVAQIVNISPQLEKVTPHQYESNLPVVGMVGRLCDQKDDLFFLRVAQKLSDKFLFVWVGGGDDLRSKRLEDNGVLVTGWVNHNAVLEFVSGLDYYFHTAAWDGFPISVLEAAKLCKPLILRDIQPFVTENLITISSIDDAVDYFENLLMKQESAIDSAFFNTDKINKEHSFERQREGLLFLYTKIGAL